MSKECFMDTVLAWIGENPDRSARQIASGTSLKVHQTSNALRTLVKKGVVLCNQRNGKCTYRTGKNIEFGRSRVLNDFNDLISCVRKSFDVPSG